MSTPQNQMKPDRSSLDIHQASHQTAMKAAQAHGDALTKLHASIAQMMSQQQPGAPADQGYGGGGDQQQAVWDAFPSTDPQQMQQALQQGANPEDLFWQDVQKLHDMHTQQVEAIMNQLGAPAGEPMQGAPPGAPAVGGEGLGA